MKEDIIAVQTIEEVYLTDLEKCKSHLCRRILLTK